MPDVVTIKSIATEEVRRASTAPLTFPVTLFRSRYPEQGSFLGVDVEVRMPSGPVDHVIRGVVVRDDKAGPSMCIVLLADGNVLIVNDEKAEMLSRVAITTDEAADGEGNGWDVGKDPRLLGPSVTSVHVLEEDVREAYKHGNTYVAQLGSRMTVLEGSTHPSAFLPLCGRIRDGGIWVGWIADASEQWIALVDRRGIVAVMESNKMPAFFQRNVRRFPLELRRRAAPVKIVHINGMEVHIDKPFGAVHEGIGLDGKPYMVVQRADYGFFPRSRGEDGEEFDTYVLGNVQAEFVFVARQVHRNGSRDELKAVVGASSIEEAKDTVLAHIHPKMFAGIGKISTAKFKAALSEHQERTNESTEFVPLTDEDDLEFEAIKQVGTHLALPSDAYNVPWPDGKTNFPKAGDNKALNLRNSTHERMPLADMDDLCNNHSGLFAHADLPSTAHVEVVRRLVRAGSARTSAEACSVRCREALGDIIIISPNDHPMDERTVMRFASFGLVHPQGLEPMRAFLAQMKSGAKAAPPAVTREVDAAEVQPTTMVGDDSPPPTPKPASVEPSSGQAASDPNYPNGGADPSQLGADDVLSPVNVVPPMPVPERAIAPTPGPVARSEDPENTGPLSTRNPTGRAMSHAASRLATLVHYAAAASLAFAGRGAGEDPAQRDAIIEFLRASGGAARSSAAPSGVPGTAPGATAGVPSALNPIASGPAAVATAGQRPDKRFCQATLTITREAGEGPPTYLFIASTNAVDSYNEIVDQSWDFERYEKNPVILFAHNSHDLPIGKATSWSVQGQQLSIRLQFSEVNPLAVLVRAMVDEGMLRACSVGFMPGEITSEMVDGVKRIVLRKNSLHELSICAVPANPEALYVDEKMLDAIEQRMSRTMDEMFARAGLPRMDAQGVPPAAPPAPAPAAPAASPTLVTLGMGAAQFEAYRAMESDSWDPDAAEDRLRRLVSSDKSGRPDTMDWKSYARFFSYVDAGNEEKLGGHKLLHHDVVAGEVVTSRAGVLAAGAALMGACGGADIPDSEMAAVKAHLTGHYKQFDLEPPWERIEGEKTAPTINGEHGEAPMPNETHRTDNPSARQSFRQNGAISIPCTQCGSKHTVDLSPMRTELVEAEKAVTIEKDRAALLEVRVAEKTREVELANSQRDKAIEDLTKLELGPMTGVELYHLTPAAAQSLARLRASNPPEYAIQLSDAKARFDKGAAAAAAEVARAAAAGTPAIVAGAPPVTRAADPTPPLSPEAVPPAPGTGGPPAAPQAGESVDALMGRISQRSGVPGRALAQS